MVLELQVKENNRFSFSYYVELEEIWTAESKKVASFDDLGQVNLSKPQFS